MHTTLKRSRLPALLSLFGVWLFGVGFIFPEQPAAAQVQIHQSTYPSRSRTAATTSQSSQQPSRQRDRIYLSTNGELLGAHTIFGGTILYIDRAGDISLAARDYTAELDYDYTGRLNQIGTVSINYDYRGRVEQIGSSAIAYDYRSRLGQIGANAIAYTARGKVSQIGNVTIQYNRGHIETISNNYTNAGTRIIVVGR